MERHIPLLFEVHEWFVDGTIAVAKRGLRVGKTMRGKGMKLMVITDANGILLAEHTTSTSPHEVALIENRLDVDENTSSDQREHGKFNNMLNISFEKINTIPFFKIINWYEPYPIPINFRFGVSGHKPESILYRHNFCDLNQIEIQFDKDGMTLYDISIIGMDESAIGTFQLKDLSVPEAYYACKIHTDGPDIENDEHPMEVMRDGNSFLYLWSGSEWEALSYFAVAPHILIGMNAFSQLAAVVVKELENEYIKAIFNE
ncbi:hypothetical protein [Chitinophaga sp.]|uniref:hypothetical protein n=1 Tax=Chitinophaga sp. TaxID=1869181 RepID=UPI0031D47AFD